MGSISESYLGGHSATKNHGSKALKQTGALNKFESEDVTPVIGREFPKVNIVDDLLTSPEADTLLRDLAITSR